MLAGLDARQTAAAALRVSEVGVMVQGDVDHADDVTRTRLGAGAACFAGASVQSHVRRLVAVVAGRSRSHAASPDWTLAADKGVHDGCPEHCDGHCGGCTALFGEKRRPPDTSAM